MTEVFQKYFETNLTYLHARTHTYIQICVCISMVFQDDVTAVFCLSRDKSHRELGACI